MLYHRSSILIFFICFHFSYSLFATFDLNTPTLGKRALQNGSNFQSIVTPNNCSEDDVFLKSTLEIVSLTDIDLLSDSFQETNQRLLLYQRSLDYISSLKPEDLKALIAFIKSDLSLNTELSSTFIMS